VVWRQIVPCAFGDSWRYDESMRRILGRWTAAIWLSGGGDEGIHVFNFHDGALSDDEPARA